MDRLGSQALDTGRLINLEEPISYIALSVHHIGWRQGCLPYEFLIQSESGSLGTLTHALNPYPPLPTIPIVSQLLLTPSFLPSPFLSPHRYPDTPKTRNKFTKFNVTIWPYMLGFLRHTLLSPIFFVFSLSSLLLLSLLTNTHEI